MSTPVRFAALVLFIAAALALPLGVRADATYKSLQWNLRATHVYKSWGVATTKGAGVKVCVADTGLSLSPDIPSILAGHNSINPGSPNDWTDQESHGTFTASEIAASGAQMDGVSPNVSLLIAKVLDASGNGDESSVSSGIFWCASQGAQVISVSLGGDASNYDGIAVAVQYVCRADHVLFAVSAGNDGVANAQVTPGGIVSPCLVAVNASDKTTARDGVPASFSNTGVNPRTITAPGTTIVGDDVNGGVTIASGTSMAAPEAAGVMALLLGEGVSSDAVIPILLSTADHPRSVRFTGSYRTNPLLGSGLLDAYAATVKGLGCTKGQPACLKRTR